MAGKCQNRTAKFETNLNCWKVELKRQSQIQNKPRFWTAQISLMFNGCLDDLGTCDSDGENLEILLAIGVFGLI